MIDLFLEGQLAETAVLLAVLVVAVLAVRTLLRLPAEVKPAPAAAALSPVPPAIPIPPAECAFRHGVTEVEREELMLIAQAHAAGLAPFGAEARAQRAALDGFTRRVFDSFREQPAPEQRSAEQRSEQLPEQLLEQLPEQPAPDPAPGAPAEESAEERGGGAVPVAIS